MPHDGDIIFRQAGGPEFLRLAHDGKCYVAGVETPGGEGVLTAMRLFLRACGYGDELGDMEAMAGTAGSGRNGGDLTFAAGAAAPMPAICTCLARDLFWYGCRCRRVT